MARISYVDLADVKDPEIRSMMEKAWLGRAGETRAVYAQSPVVFKYMNNYPRNLAEEGTLSTELAELVRVRVATSWDRLFHLEEAGHGCHY